MLLQRVIRKVIMMAAMMAILQGKNTATKKVTTKAMMTALPMS